MDDAIFVCLLDVLIIGFCYSYLALETGEFKLASTVTLVLQANRLTKFASHPSVLATSIFQSGKCLSFLYIFYIIGFCFLPL